MSKSAESDALLSYSPSRVYSPKEPPKYAGEFSIETNDGMAMVLGSDRGPDGASEPEHEKSIVGGVGISAGAIFWTGFALSMDSNVITPTLWNINQHFHAGILFYGVVLSLMSISETFGALILGYWSDRRPVKEPVMTAFVLIALGNFLGIMAWAFGGEYMVIISRIVAGFGTGASAVLLAYVTHTSSPQQRGKMIAGYWLCSLSSNIAGPAVCVAAANMGFAPTSMLNALTAPSVFTFFFALLNLLIVAWRWPRTASITVSEKQAQLHMDGSTNLIQKSDGGFSFGKMASVFKSLSGVAFACLYIKFVFALGVSAFSAIAAPVATGDDPGDAGLQNGVMFLAIGLLILFGVLMAKALSRCMKEHSLLQTAQIMCFIGLALGVRWPGIDEDLGALLFLVGAIFLTLGNSLGITICSTVFSKAIGQFHPFKGTLMGWFVTMGSIARIIGPILATVGFSALGLGLVCAVLWILQLIGIAMFSFFRIKLAYLQVPSSY